MAIIDLSSKKTTLSNDNLTKIYNSHKSGFIAFVRSKFSGFPLSDTEEIYNDSFLALYENIQSGKLTSLTCSLQTYINQIGRNKILDYYKKRRIEVDYFEDIGTSDFADNINEVWDNLSPDRKTVLYNFLEKMDDVNCKKIIFAFYYDGLSMDTIANSLNLKNADVAKTTKNRCLQKMKKTFRGLIEKKEFN